MIYLTDFQNLSSDTYLIKITLVRPSVLGIECVLKWGERLGSAPNSAGQVP